LRTHKERGLQRPSLTDLGEDVEFGAVLYGALRVVDDHGYLVHRVEAEGVPCIPFSNARGEAETGGISITILWHYPRSSRRGPMNGWQERYWLVRRGRRGPVTGERWVEDFVCCEVPVGEDTAMALEVFTSRERAEAESQGIERLAPGEYYPRETLSDRVVELVTDELVKILDVSGIPYVLVDPPPVDEPIPEGLRIEPTPVFAEGLGRPLLGEMKKGRA
jgi:hypothetical protein